MKKSSYFIAIKIFLSGCSFQESYDIGDFLSIELILFSFLIKLLL